MVMAWDAVERMMKLQEVICRALAGTLTWLQAADILGMHPRTVRRWRARYQAGERLALYDRRHGPSPRKAPATEIERILRLHQERYAGGHVRHFHRFARREHGVTLSYSFVRLALQEAGLVRKGRPRGRHRRRREPRPCFGELLHLDGSDHVWLTRRPVERQTLIAVIDDATKRLVYAQLWPSESTEAVFSALRTVCETAGLPMALYTDRASWAFYTRRAGERVDRTRLTQVGRALHQLGIEHIPSYSPQARGRVDGSTARCRIASSRSSRSTGSTRSRPPMPISTIASSPPTTTSSPDRPWIPPRRLCPWAPSISIRSSATSKSAPWATTTSSPSTRWRCKSPNNPAAAPAPACASACAVTSMASTPSGMAPGVWGAMTPAARRYRVVPAAASQRHAPRGSTDHVLAAAHISVSPPTGLHECAVARASQSVLKHGNAWGVRRRDPIDHEGVAQARNDPGPRVQILKNADPFSFSMNRTNTKVQSNSILDRTDHVSKPSGQFTCQQHSRRQLLSAR